MSLLSKLLKAEDSLFSLAIKQLEDATYRQGIDTALIGEIIGKAYDRAGKMGLDPDFNGKELYYSLINRVKLDNERVAKLIGGKDHEDLYEMVPLITKYVQKLDLPKNGWFMKESVAKKMLKNQPPVQVMKLLGYKDVVTMLDKESLFEIYGALRFAENPDWLNSFIEQYKKLKPADFENRKVVVINFDEKKWGNVAEHFIEKKLHNITHLKELGVIMTMPIAKTSSMSGKGVTLKVLPLLIHYFNEVHLYSTFFKLISVRKNFGELLVDTLIADTANVSIINKNHKIHWRVIQRYYGKLKDESHPEVFQPHVQPEDLHWRKAEEVLYEIDPELEFWEDMDYVSIIVDGETVTLNLMDIALSYANGLKYEERYLYHFRDALWNEIFVRYMGQKVLEEQILQQLDNELIAPEKIVKEKRGK
jgi:hypothetical protein